MPLSCVAHGILASAVLLRIPTRGSDDFGEGTSFEALYDWETAKIKSYLMAINGISGKSVACLLLYRMGRVTFAVDANVLRVMTRLGWLKHLGIYATEALASSDRKVAARNGLVQPLGAPRNARVSHCMIATRV